MNQKILVVVIVLILAMVPVSLAYASGQLIPEEVKPYRAGMVVNILSAHDPFNSLVLEGLYLVSREEGYTTTLTIARDSSDFDAAFAENILDSDVMVCAGYDLKDVMTTSARANPDHKYITVDMDYDEDTIPSNMVNIVFRSQEASYVAGYIAGMMTTSRSIGFLGGMDTVIIDQFYYAFRAGVDTAAKERGMSITLLKEVVGSYMNPDKGGELTTKMYDEGADIVFVVAGNSGNGGIEVAKNLGKYVIGVDTDQKYLAPDNVIFSVTKSVDTMIYEMVKKYGGGDYYDGQVYSVGYAEGGVDVVSYLDVVPKSAIAQGEIYKQAIINGTLVVPNTEESYAAWRAAL